MTKNNKENQIDNDVIEQIKEIIEKEINDAKSEIVKEISSELKKQLSKEEIKENPYEKISEWNKDAMRQIKKEMTESIEKGDVAEQKRLEKNAAKMDKMINEVIGLVEKIKKDEKNEDYSRNPLYDTKGIRWLPGLGKYFKRKHDRSSRNWLGLLFTGLGLIILSSGIWNASEELFSIQGSIITGAVILILMAWLERRKIFAIFGEE